MQITIAITRLIISKGAFVCLIYVAISSIVERSLSSLRAFKEWSKENVKTRTTRSRTIENKSIRNQCAYILVKRFCDEFHYVAFYRILYILTEF
ncbi:hypothetical protein T12_3417 [Trichinella patagoniensis]|uniref:Uncharacterized protein n=1 Tax=Trichinella patagoniensis TaxID=990121 RepID=A0A0V0Z3V5_9BILA|nr:hypothetical protein T12_3417 [Trichinella patagoniensis]